MKFTRATEYAIRTVLYIAAQEGREVVGRREICREMGVPYPFLGKISQLLARAGLLEIRQGVHGGYKLVRGAGRTTLLAVVEAIEGELFLSDCVERPGTCDRSVRCPVHRSWTRVRERLRRMLAQVRFDDLVRGERGARRPSRSGGHQPAPQSVHEGGKAPRTGGR